MPLAARTSRADAGPGKASARNQYTLRTRSLGARTPGSRITVPVPSTRYDRPNNAQILSNAPPIVWPPNCMGNRRESLLAGRLIFRSGACCRRKPIRLLKPVLLYRTRCSIR
jgi:hypothetical protein